MTKNSGLHDFAFDKVFAERTLQPHVYEEAARRLVMEFLNGTSASIICSLDYSCIDIVSFVSVVFEVEIQVWSSQPGIKTRKSTVIHKLTTDVDQHELCTFCRSASLCHSRSSPD